MGTFANAFTKGQAAAMDAQRARNEIATVLKRLDAEISSETDGQIQIAVMPIVMGSLRYTPVNVAEIGMPKPDAILQLPKHYAIAARAAQSEPDKWYQLARFGMDTNGYPCTLEYGDQNVRTHNREALERALVDLLASAWAGERLRPLLKQ